MLKVNDRNTRKRYPAKKYMLKINDRNIRKSVKHVQ